MLAAKTRRAALACTGEGACAYVVRGNMEVKYASNCC